MSQSQRVVYLLHGIRTNAHWMEPLGLLLQSEGFVVAPDRYGYFNVFSFINPFNGKREGKIDRAHKEIKRVFDRYPGAEISIISHSFGTWLLSEVMKRERFDFSRIVLCGSVVKEEFDWGQFKNLDRPRVVNECGVRDVWPILAKVIGNGYGAAGSFGFHGTYVKNRYHNVGHSGFFDIRFWNRFWIPFLRHGELNAGYSGGYPCRTLKGVLEAVQLKYIVGASLVGCAVWVIFRKIA